MSYATLDDILARFERPDLPELTQLTAGNGGPRDDARIAMSLDEASGEMDLYLGSVYTLPLAGLTLPQTRELERLCCDIARYRLWADRASSEVRQRYEDARKTLIDIAAGRIRLVGPPSGGAAGQACASAGPRSMTRDSLSGVL